MPIDVSLIAPLINAATKKFPEWKHRYYKRVAHGLQVHTKGQLFSKIDTLFPNEHPDSKAHCLATYEPITKSSVWKGINNISRIFSNSSFTIDVGEELKEYLEAYNHEGSNLLTHFLDLWVHKAVAEDPNGLFVVYPPDYAEGRDMCPLQFVRSEHIRACGRLPDGTQFVAFASEHDSTVEYNMERIATKREVFYDEDVRRLNAVTFTETTYNERLEVKIVKEVVHLVTLDGILIYEAAKPELGYTVANFAEPLSALPVFPAGGPIADMADMPLFESFVGPFIPFGNLALLQHRNHRAVDLQFSYPRMSELQTPCDAPGCLGGEIKVPKSEQFPAGLRNCLRCKGHGFVTSQSPYKSYQRKYDPNDMGNNEHLKVPPVEFYSPDVGIVSYSKEAWRDYLKMAEEAIFVMQKVYTGQVQSEESKNVDLEDLYAWLLNISKVFYNNMRMVLQALEDYVARSPVKVAVEKPYSFAVLTEEEAFVALNNILGSNTPVFVKANQVENFVSKFVSKTSPITKALVVLKQYDPLLFYSTNEVQLFKSSNAITQEMWTKHILGYPTLLKLYEQDKTLFDEPVEAIAAKIDADIATYKIPPGGAGIRSTLIPQFVEPVAAG